MDRKKVTVTKPIGGIDKLRQLEGASSQARRALSSATLQRMAAEGQERAAAEKAMAAERAMRTAIREAALAAGIDPDKPFNMNLGKGEFSQETNAPPSAEPEKKPTAEKTEPPSKKAKA